MDIRVLKYFVAAAQSGSISAASKALYITQPTLTRQFKELEEELKHKLFVRSKHGIKLTAKGELFYERALEVLSLIDDLSAEIKSDAEISGTISIAAAELRAVRLIAAAMRSLAQKYPQVNFDLRTAVRRDALNLVDQHGFDFALLVRPADTKSYNVLTLDPECCWGLIVKADSELGSRQSIGTAELKELPLIMSRSELDDRTFEGWLGYPLKELRCRVTYNLLNNGCRLVEADLGAAVCLSGIVDKLPDGLTFVPFAPKLCVSSSLVWQKGRRLTKAAELFLQEIKTQLI